METNRPNILLKQLQEKLKTTTERKEINYLKDALMAAIFSERKQTTEEEQLLYETITTKNTTKLAKLGNHKNEHIRTGVANNPNTPTETLKNMYQKEINENVKLAITKNPNTPTNTLTALGNENNPHIDEELTENPNTPAKTLQQIINRTGKEIQYPKLNFMFGAKEENAELAYERIRINTIILAAAKNPNTPTNTLKQLQSINHNNKSVTTAVETNRCKKINNYINTLGEPTKTLALLLAPTFTGWEDELTNLITNLETKSTKRDNNQKIRTIK